MVSQPDNSCALEYRLGGAHRILEPCAPLTSAFVLETLSRAQIGDVPSHVANGRALLIDDYAASPVQARPLSVVAVAECAA
jgi:hypothetical protein